MTRTLALVSLLALTCSALAGGPARTTPKNSPPPPVPVAAPPPEPPKPLPGDKRRIIGILDVRIDGAPPEIGAQFQKDLEAQVDIKHYFLAPKMRMHDLMAQSTKWTEGCVVGSCLKDVKIQTNADVVLLAALNGSGTSFGWVVTLVRTDSGNVLAQKSERCDVCTVSEALSAATLATVDLLSTIPETLPDESARHIIDPAPTKPLEEKIVRIEHRDRVGGVALTVIGLVAAAAGAGVYFAHDHANYGLATATAGGGMALAGVVVLTF